MSTIGIITYTLFCNLLLDLIFFKKKLDTYRLHLFNITFQRLLVVGIVHSKCIFCFACHNSSYSYSKGVICVQMSHIVSLEIKGRPTKWEKQRLFTTRERQHSHLRFAETERQAAEWELSGGRGGGLQVCPDWICWLVAASRLTGSRLSYLLGVHM